MHMCFCVLLYFTACMLYYCNTVGWAWWDCGLIWWLTILLQCFDTVGWVTWPVKISSPNDLYCVEWDVKPYSTQLIVLLCFYSNCIGMPDQKFLYRKLCTVTQCGAVFDYFVCMTYNLNSASFQVTTNQSANLADYHSQSGIYYSTVQTCRTLD